MTSKMLNVVMPPVVRNFLEYRKKTRGAPFAQSIREGLILLEKQEMAKALIHPAVGRPRNGCITF